MSDRLNLAVWLRSLALLATLATLGCTEENPQVPTADGGRGSTDAGSPLADGQLGGDCAAGDRDRGACGLNNAGTTERTCIDGQWAEWSPCDDPDVCTSGAESERLCGLNDRGQQGALCVDGQWSDWGSCTDPDICTDGEEVREACPEGGVRARGCVDGQWADWGACGDMPDCANGDTAQEACPDGGVRARGCVDNRWSEWSPCEGAPECDADTEQRESCGLNESGTRQRRCLEGTWDAWARCEDPDACVNGTEERSACGLQGNGTQDRACVDGQWTPFGACDDPDRSCEDEATEIVPCGLNLRGQQIRACVDGRWAPPGACEDLDGCIDGAEAGQACGLNDNGRRARSCVEGQWSDWAACADADVCVNADTQTDACGINQRGRKERRCEAGNWARWSRCEDADVCTDDAAESLECGLNGRGDRARSCVSGQWSDWAECVDPDACVDGIEAVEPCDGGHRARRCVSGDWTRWSDCVPDPECEDGEIGEQACGLNGRGRQVRDCQRGVWSRWFLCVDTDTCVDGASESRQDPLCDVARSCEEGRWTAWSVCDDRGPACDAEAVFPIEADGRYAFDTRGQGGDNVGSCVSTNNDGGQGEKVFALTLDARSDVRIEVVRADFDTVIYIRAECESTLSEVNCNDDAVRAGDNLLSLIETTLNAGTWYIFIDGFQGAGGQGEVEVFISDPSRCVGPDCALCVDALESNDHIGGATPFVAGQTYENLGVCPDADPTDWFATDILTPSNVVIRNTRADANETPARSPFLSAFDPDQIFAGGGLLTRDAVRFAAIAPGVHSYRITDRGMKLSYGITFDIEPLNACQWTNNAAGCVPCNDPAGPNDSLETAIPIVDEWVYSAPESVCVQLDPVDTYRKRADVRGWLSFSVRVYGAELSDRWPRFQVVNENGLPIGGDLGLYQEDEWFSDTIEVEPGDYYLIITAPPAVNTGVFGYEVGAAVE